MILPKDLLARLGVEAGDSLFATETPEAIQLRQRDPDFETQMEVARQVMKKRRAALRELAK